MADPTRDRLQARVDQSLASLQEVEDPSWRGRYISEYTKGGSGGGTTSFGGGSTSNRTAADAETALESLHNQRQNQYNRDSDNLAGYDKEHKPAGVQVADPTGAVDAQGKPVMLTVKDASDLLTYQKQLQKAGGSLSSGVSAGRLAFDQAKEQWDQMWSLYQDVSKQVDAENARAFTADQNDLNRASEERRNRTTAATNLGVETSRALTETMKNVAPIGTEARRTALLNGLGAYIPGSTPLEPRQPMIVDPNQVAQTAVNTTRGLLSGGDQGLPYEPQMPQGWTQQYVPDAQLAGMTPDQRIAAAQQLGKMLSGVVFGNSGGGE